MKNPYRPLAALRASLALILFAASLAAAHHADPKQGPPWYVPPGIPQPATPQMP